MKTAPAAIKTVTVLGGGSAGFITALTLKRKRPRLHVRVLRSPERKIIGVGESTTPVIPNHFHGYLGLHPGKFYAEVRPTWKMGIRFLWGPRQAFNYSFLYQVDHRHPDLPKSNGFYCFEDFTDADFYSALMSRNRVFSRQPNGAPEVTPGYAYHLENRKLVAYLEARCVENGVRVVDAMVRGASRREDGGIAALHLDSGEQEIADLYVDASGFHAELLGKEMEEPFESYEDSLFTDRAVVGGWAMGKDEVIEPYTTAETMEAGWCWRIDHDDSVNRGYVFSSAHLTDEEATAEFRRKNPRVGETHVIRFRTGRYRRMWVGNVVGVGNASGFVEPLEATALMTLCLQSRALADGLAETDDAPTPSMTALYNRYVTGLWDEIRNFLSIHYRFNRRIENDFWRRCHSEVALHGAEDIVEFYRENGPSVVAKSVLVPAQSPFGIEGYFTLLLGQKVRHDRLYKPPAAELARWNHHRSRNEMKAKAALDARQALDMIHSPRWRWV